MNRTHADSNPSIPPGLTAVITGAGSGVGAAVALALGQRGVQVALVGRRVDKLSLVQQAIRNSGGTAESFPCDVSQPDQVLQLETAVRSRFGGIQVLFNSAGIHTELVPIGESTPELWIRTLNVNLIGAYLTCRSFMGAMIQHGWGRIINVSSAAALAAPGGIASAYQLSKVAINHFTRQLAAELQGSGVTANVLHPGEVKTEMWSSIKNDALHRAGPGKSALNWARWVEETGGDPPEKTVDVVLRLLSSVGEQVNGEFLWIRDGLQKPLLSW